MAAMPNVFTIPSSAPFAQTLVRGLLAQADLEKDKLALSRATIYLPTRRAVRNLAEVFARELGGAALLPEMRPLGDVDEDEAFFDEAFDDLDLPPSIAPIRRQLLLAQLVRRFQKDLTFAQAASLASGLAKFLDEAQTQGADLSKLEDLAPERFAEHWGKVRDFLRIIRDHWPSIVKDEGAIDPAERRNLALTALAIRLAKNPPTGLVIAAGSTGSIPATANLLGVIAGLPNGAVILPGLDRELDRASWNDLDPGHPQYGMKQLLARIGVTRSNVTDWQPSPVGNRHRENVLREVLRPAPTTDAWRAIAETGTEELARGIEGLSIVEAGHPGEEALAIALILRETLETPKQTAALVTPDRNLARRVAAEMRRWNIEIDDSAGCPLANTPPGTFLCLIAEAADQEFAPVPLLALLKHPFCSCGEVTSEFRRKVRALDRLALRRPRPDPGLDGIARTIDAAERSARDRKSATAETIGALKPWFKRAADILRPLEEMMRSDLEISTTVECHGRVAEALAATADARGASILWRSEAGNKAADFVAALKIAAEDIGVIEASSYSVLFRALAEGPSVRPNFDRHPRLSILGPLEARLQSFDTVVLGGLNEGVWPQSAPIDPWLSRPMRETLNLEQPERAIGLSAHDFASLTAGPRVVLTRALKSEGSPTIASRWLQRLWQLTHGLDLEKKLAPDRNYCAWAQLLDTPNDAPQPVKRPAPTPPVEMRPRGLSVTEIEKWLRDPYWVYAKHILHLTPLDPLDDEVGPLERGNAIHTALERFLLAYPNALPDDAEAKLIAIADDVFAEAAIPHAALAIWRPRFENAARWFVEEERTRRANIKQSFIEKKGSRVFQSAGGDFTLRCRADRIDILQSGGAAIVDYKTGAVPSKDQLKTLLAPQLPLEGAILKAGGFADTGPLSPDALLYIQFSGGKKPGDIVEVPDVAKLVEEAEQRLVDRVHDFDRAEKPYHAQVAPVDTRRDSDYGHLERVREWLDGGWSE